MKRLAILLLLAGTAQAEYEVDPTCALFICMYDGHISYTDSTCLKARREMLERTAMSVVKFWERISPIEEYTSCIYDGPTPANGLESDPDAQIMVRSYSKLIETEPDPDYPLRVTIEPGKCEAADRGELQAVIKKGDCRATLRTYKGYLYGTQLDTVLHVDEETLTVYQENSITGVTEIIIDPDGPVPAPAPPVVLEPVEAERPVVQQAAVQGTIDLQSSPASGGPEFNAILSEVDSIMDELGYMFEPGWEMNMEDGYYGITVAEGLQQVFRATGDLKYLTAMVALARNYIDSGYDMDGDGYWDLDGAYDEGTAGGPTQINVDHFEMRASTMVATALIEMQRSGYSDAAGSKDKLLGFLQHDFWDKWSAGNGIISDGYLRSDIHWGAISEAGRSIPAAIALDLASSTPGNNQYNDYLTSASGTVGKFFPAWKNNVKNGRIEMPAKTDGTIYEDRVQDTSHLQDFVYGVMLMNQSGYNPQGLMPDTMKNMETWISETMFRSSAGFAEFTDGSGPVNGFTQYGAAAAGYSMTASLSNELRDRWVDFYQNGEPFANHHSGTKLWMAGGILSSF